VTTNGSGTGNFTSNLTGLQPSTTYYVRAYATNAVTTVYGNQVQFTAADWDGSIVSNPGAGVTFGGYTYTTVVLGNGQEWMAENLRTTTYANGDPIPNVTDNTAWLQLTTGAWVHCLNNSSYENPYGKLYNWYAVVDPRNVCPTGWHVPTDGEWTVLSDYLGGESVAGGKMKSTSGWEVVETEDGDLIAVNGTNESGFSGLPGGERAIYDGGSETVYDTPPGGIGVWWSATANPAPDDDGAVSRQIGGFIGLGLFDSLWSLGYEKRSGFSVRCLRD
jgi:uncharacterized protein (TIGR02145 family)